MAMLDLNFIRENRELVKSGVASKNLSNDIVDKVLDVDKNRRDLLVKVEELRKQRNQYNDELKSGRNEEIIAKSVELKNQLDDLEPELRKVEAALGELMLQVPNIPLEEVPIGKDDKDNKVIKTVGQKKSFDFTPRDHVELGKMLDILDTDRGTKVAGFRGYFLKNEGVLLAMGVMRYALDKLAAKGFTMMMPPVIDRRSAFVNTGHFPWGESEAYKLAEDGQDPQNDYFLAGTAEVPLVSYYSGETFNEGDLPIKMVGFSPCFRREIGNHGKDTKGIFRVHEFYKVEQVVICKNDIDESRKWHDEMLSYSEEILQDLGLHYQVLLMCSGDMGEPQAKKYDIETWMPGRDAFGETASDSIMTDFQSRRAGIRYRTGEGTKFVHMLNNTAAPSARLIVAILENYQQADGSIIIPEVLVPYVGIREIKPKL
jgi:seryl-tRNA synthetase